MFTWIVELGALLDEVDNVFGRVSVHVVEDIGKLENHLVIIDLNSLVV
jgi:hypothetical protein